MEWVYLESNMAASAFRGEYETSLDQLILQRRSQTDEARTVYAEKLLKDPENCRKEFEEMLGWPLTQYNPQQPIETKNVLLYQDDGMPSFTYSVGANEGFLVWRIAVFT